MKLDIAAGANKKEGFTGIDIMPGSDIVHDLEVYPWPIESDSVEEAVCNHYFEHVTDSFKFMNEVARVMKVGAQITINCPYYTSARASQDPTHKRGISEMSFLYYNKKWREDNKLSHYPVDDACDFDYTYGYHVNEPWNTKHEEARAFAIKHYFNSVSDITVVMTKRG
jgi:ubiquinone/menaquinone biosynthesis C-methylase UbiE